MGTIRNLIRPNGQYMGQNDKREMQYGLPEFGNQTIIFPHNRWHACWHKVELCRTNNTVEKYFDKWGPCYELFLKYHLLTKLTNVKTSCQK